MDKFAKSLAEGFRETKDINPTIDVEDSIISKSAGIDIYQPSPENVENYVRKYVLGELSFFPKTVKVDIKLIPQSFNTTKIRGESDSIKDASGTVIITLHGKKIELPFIIHDSEFEPFDVIQMEKERVPYNRENLAKVLMNLDNIASNPELLNEDNPFAGSEKVVSEMSDEGFLGDTLKIQDEVVNSSPFDNEIVVNASRIDNLLEKTAKVAPLRKQDLTKLEKFLTEKFAEEFINEMEKIASEDIADIENHAKLVLGKLNDLKFQDVNTMQNGAKIVFPEKDGGQLSMTKAIVLKEVVEPAYKDNKEALFQSNNAVVVITEDNRFIVLRDRQKFYGIPSQDDWTFKTKTVRSIKDDRIYTALIGNKVVRPFICHNIEEYTEAENIIDKPFNVECKIYPDGRFFRIAGVPGTKFEYMSRKDIVERKPINLSPDAYRIFTNMLPYSFFACDEDMSVIELNGFIKDYLVDPKQFTFTQSDEIFKSASADNGGVDLKLIDKQRDLFDLTVTWRDTSKKIFKMEKREFKSIPGQKAKGILKAAGMDYAGIVALLQAAVADNHSTAKLPPNATPEKISGGFVEGKVQSAINKVKNTAFGRETVDAAIAEILGRQFGEAAINYGVDAANFLSTLSSYASESEALAVKFEKLAKENQSQNLLDIAKLMVAQHNIDKMACEAYSKNEKFVFAKEAAAEIVNAKDVLEKVATELIMLKRAQVKNDNEIVSPGYITGAVNVLDRMYKMAKALTKKAGENVACTPDGLENKDLGKEVKPEDEATKKEMTVEDKVVEKQ